MLYHIVTGFIFAGVLSKLTILNSLYNNRHYILDFAETQTTYV